MSLHEIIDSLDYPALQSLAVWIEETRHMSVAALAVQERQRQQVHGNQSEAAAQG